VLLGINMQTSFMHPPFGFALFYLRSVAARVPYLDKITGKRTEPVTTAQIYWGAVPFVCIQVLMVGLALLFPQMIMRYKGEPVAQTEIQLQAPAVGGLGGTSNGGGLQGQQSLGLPPLGAPSAAPAIPGQATPAAPAVDLSQPPKIN
jgi:Tripartite ATP-independent periplasmic transporter, DctM component